MTTEELDQRYYPRGATYNRDEIALMISAASTGNQGPVPALNYNPGTHVKGRYWTFTADGTYTNFPNSSGTPIVIDPAPTGKMIVNGQLYDTGVYYIASFNLVDKPNVDTSAFVNKTTDIAKSASDQKFDSSTVIADGVYTVNTGVSGYYKNCYVKNTDGSFVTGSAAANWAVLQVPFGSDTQLTISGFLANASGHTWRQVDNTGALIAGQFGTATGSSVSITKSGSAVAVQFNFKRFDETLATLLASVMVNSGATSKPWVAYVVGNINAINSVKIEADTLSAANKVPTPTGAQMATPKAYVDGKTTTPVNTNVDAFVNTPVVPVFTYTQSTNGDISLGNVSSSRIWDAIMFGAANPADALLMVTSTIRYWLVLGYKDATNLCIVGISNTGRFGRVCNLDLTAATFAVISESSIAALAGTDVGKVQIVDDNILMYKNNVLTLTLSKTNLLAAGANLQNVKFGIAAFNSGGTSLVNGSIIVKGLQFIKSVDNSTQIAAINQTLLTIGNNIKGKIVKVFGDSISDKTATYNGMYDGAYWWQLIASKYGLNIDVNAISGSSIGTPTVAGPVPLSDDSRLATYNAIGTPDVFIIFMGTNDFGARAVPLGTSADLATNKATFYGALKYVLNYLCTSAPAAKIFIMTPLHRGESGFPEQKGTGPVRYLADYVAAIKYVAGAYGAHVIPTDQISGLTYYNMQGAPLTGADQLHPTPLGHTYLAAPVGATLNSSF